MPIAVTPLALVGVLALCRSPWTVVVERGTAVTIGASCVMLADTDIVDLHSSGRTSRIRGTAVGMSVTEATPL